MKINGLTSEETILLRATLRRHRKVRHLSPMEVANLLKRALDAGNTMQSLNSKTNTSIDQLNKFLRLFLIQNSGIKSSIVWGQTTETKLGMSVASELARLEKNEDQEIVFENALKNRFTKSELIELIALYKRTGKPIKECINQVLETRPTTIEKHVIIGKITSPSLAKRLSGIGPFGRNKILIEVLELEFPLLKYDGAKLKKKKFMIFGNNETKEFLLNLENGFEDIITDLIKKKISLTN